MSKSILITGAGGFIGGFLVEEALKRGYDTWAAVRATTSREFLKDERIHFIELNYSFNIKDSTFTGYYNELINMAPESSEDPDWQLLWQGSFAGKWVLLHSVDLDHDYIYMGDMVFDNVHGVLARYDVLGGRVLFYGATNNTLRVTTPLTFKRIDMHHPVNE